MSKLNFTKRTLEVLPVLAKDRAIYRDNAVRGLGIKIEPSGHRVFFWSRKVNGRLAWKTIGAFEDTTVEEARAKASEYNTSLARWKREDHPGADPFQRPAEMTLDEAAEEYIKRRVRHHAKRPERGEKNVRAAVKNYLSHLRSRRLSSIRNDEVRALHRKIGETHQRTANVAVTLLRIIFNFAINEQLWRGENPADGFKLYAETKRKRYILPDELPGFFSALRRAPSQDLKDVVTMLLFTGARKDNVHSMRWQEVSTASATWIIPETKSGDHQEVFLLPECIEVLERRRAEAESSPFVFASHGRTGHIVDLKKQWIALLKDAGLYHEDRALRPCFHDLRRTFASWQAGLGISRTIIGKGLGHMPGSRATAIYEVLDATPVRDAMYRMRSAMLATAEKKLLPAVAGRKRG